MSSRPPFRLPRPSKSAMKCKRHTKNSEELDRLRTELISKVAAFLLRKNREAKKE